MNAIAEEVKPPALCVDCDGTLIRTDLLHEAVFRLMKQSPLSVLLLPLWLMHGKAYLKDQLAKRVEIEPALLPYNAAFLEFLRHEKAAGRELVLATASPRRFADAISSHLGIFDSVQATENGVNLSSANKADRLSQVFGERGFEYAGNSHADLEVWKHAAGAVLVDVPSGVKNRVAGLCPVSHEFSSARPGLKAYLRAMRLHQWLKNLLVFIPVLAAHRFLEPGYALNAVLAFLAYGLCASSVYLLNDLLDLPSDRSHPRKKTRPFASGSIPLVHGAVLVPSLLLAAGGLSLLLPAKFALILGAYFVTTLAYSIWLKNKVIIDVILLAMLYTFRIIAGGAATSIEPSFWLLSFSMFMFLSLAMVKRYAEMLVVMKQNGTATAGRGYRVDDCPLLMNMGSASGFVSIMVLALYVNSPDVPRLYSDPTLLWLVLPLLLFWISRVWMKTHRGEMHDDPVVFAAKDRVSLITGVLTAAVFIAAT